MKKDKEWFKQQLVKYYPSKGEIDNPDYEVIAKVEIIDEAFKLIDQLDEPEQVVPSEMETTTVKQDDAIWFEDMAKNFGVTIMETVVIPEMISEYIEKEKGKNILGNIAEEIYNNDTSWSRLTLLQKWLRLNFTLFAKAWISGDYTIEQPKLLTVIVKDYDKTIMSKQLPEDEVNKMMEGLG